MHLITHILCLRHWGKNASTYHSAVTKCFTARQNIMHKSHRDWFNSWQSLLAIQKAVWYPHSEHKVNYQFTNSQCHHCHV